MANINNTDPDNPKKLKYFPKKNDWEWREGVVKELKLLGVPHTTAEVSIIDNRETFDKCCSNKLTSQQTALLLISFVERMYNNSKPYKCPCSSKVEQGPLKAQVVGSIPATDAKL